MSENYENTTQVNETPAEEEIVETAAVEETAEVAESEVEAVAEQTDETVIELEDDFAAEEEIDPEINMTTGQKLKVLLMKPLASSIIKWVCFALGIAGMVLYFIANSSRSMGESFAKIFSGVSGVIATIFGFFPVSMFEIIICATALGILAYLVYIIVRTVQVKGGFHKGGLWVQFGYTLLAVAGVFALLMSMCYGIFTYRQPLSKASNGQYSNGKVTNQEFTETMLYLVDKINNTLYDGNDYIFFNKSGQSRYATQGRSTDVIAKKVSIAFDNAAKDIPTLKGPALKAKDLLFKPVYSKFRVASVYSPFTAELCVNTQYPEVIIPMQIAKTMAMQRGYTNDADASFIAFLVCTEYSDDYYLQYSGYFNAYVELSSRLYKVNGKNLHLYMANSLKESAKREYVQLVKKLDDLYNVSSELEYIPAANTLSASKYCDVAKLMIKNLRSNISSGVINIDNTETYNFGAYCNFLTNYYKVDADFQDEIETVYDEYHPTLD